MEMHIALCDRETRCLTYIDIKAANMISCLTCLLYVIPGSGCSICDR